MIFGTPRYMSPEQVEGRDVDHRADLYALGVMLYEMATGVLPFEGRSVMALLNKHLHETPPPPSQRFPRLGLPARLEALILALMGKQASARPDDTAAVLAELEEIAAELEEARSSPGSLVSAGSPSTPPGLLPASSEGTVPQASDAAPPKALPTPAAPHPIVAPAAEDSLVGLSSMDELPRQRGGWVVPALLGAAVAVVATLAVLRYQAAGAAKDGGVAAEAGPVRRAELALSALDASAPANRSAPDLGKRASADGGARGLGALRVTLPPRRRGARSTGGRTPRRRPSRRQSAPRTAPVDAGTAKVAAAPAPRAGSPGSVGPARGAAPVPVRDGGRPAAPVPAPAEPQRAVARTTRSASDYVRMARQAMWHHDHVKAGQLLTEAKRLAPRSADVHGAWADFYFERERFDAAQKAAQRAVQLRPGGARELLRLAQVAFKRGDRNLACSSVREVLRRQPGDARAVRYLRKMRCP